MKLPFLVTIHGHLLESAADHGTGTGDDVRAGIDISPGHQIRILRGDIQILRPGGVASGSRTPVGDNQEMEKVWATLLQNGSVRLVTPKSAEFESLYASLVSADVTDAWFKPLSVIIANDGMSPILGYSVRFDREYDNGRRSPATITHLGIQRGSEGSRLKPGEKRFICIFNDVSLAIGNRRLISLSTADESLRQQYTHVRTVQASIDSVINDQFQVTGPDRVGLFEKISQQRAAEQGLMESLRDASDQGQNRVVQILEEKIQQASALRANRIRDHGVEIQGFTARFYSQILATKGLLDLTRRISAELEELKSIRITRGAIE